ncbi:MAG: BamA/TamA family outer membrane protein, partial [Burkholderiaceae bacterium]
EAGVGKLRYTRLDYQFQQYWPLTKKYTIALNTEFGLGQGSDGRPLPIFKNFYGGGLGSVRGFEQGTFGGKSKVDGSSSNLLNVGGDRKVLANMEFITPFPGAGTDRTLRMFGFVDVGNVYCTAGAGVECSPTANKLRASSGVGISWISPVGPLRLAWAKPLAKQDGDKMQTLQFSIGTSF